jgi:hypothetical protein
MPGAAQFDVLFLMRNDKEAAGSEQPIGKLKPHQRLHVHTQGSKGSDAAADSSRRSAGSSSSGSSAGSPTAADAVAAGALEQLQQLGLTYSIREWGFQHENYTKEASKVRSIGRTSVLFKL